MEQEIYNPKQEHYKASTITYLPDGRYGVYTPTVIFARIVDTLEEAKAIADSDYEKAKAQAEADDDLAKNLKFKADGDDIEVRLNGKALPIRITDWGDDLYTVYIQDEACGSYDNLKEAKENLSSELKDWAGTKSLKEAIERLG